MQENKFKKLRIIFDKIYDNINFDYFVKYDPIQIPHLFKNKKDIETISLFTAILSWGRRSIIINKCYEIIKIMNYQPYNFVMQHSNKDLSLFKNFRHRTFNHIDIVNIIKSLKYFYTLHNSIEDIFLKKKNTNMKNAINYFKQYFIDHKMDLYKYISSPNEKSACKKINMFLRWMVRKDSKNIDFGIWNKINPQDLICPIDIHVGNAARNLHLIKDNKYNNWNAAEELTSNLKMINKSDPIKYDIVLFTISKENIIIS